MFQRWPKRDPNKHYYLVPNEVFNLGLSSHEIAVYNYVIGRNIDFPTQIWHIELASYPRS